MRTKKEILSGIDPASLEAYMQRMAALLEVLVDIRDVLADASSMYIGETKAIQYRRMKDD